MKDEKYENLKNNYKLRPSSTHHTAQATQHTFCDDKCCENVDLFPLGVYGPSVGLSGDKGAGVGGKELLTA